MLRQRLTVYHRTPAEQRIAVHFSMGGEDALKRRVLQPLNLAHGDVEGF